MKLVDLLKLINSKTVVNIFVQKEKDSYSVLLYEGTVGSAPALSSEIRVTCIDVSNNATSHSPVIVIDSTLLD